MRFISVLFTFTASLLLLLLASCHIDDPVLVTQEAKPIVLTKAQESVRDASNNFGFRVYNTLYDNNRRDVVFSPMGLSLALSMAALGSCDGTWEQFSDVLGWNGATKQDVSSYYNTMISGLVEADPTVRFGSFNSMWVSKGFGISQNYRSSIKNDYGADGFVVDFSSSETVNRINEWVAKKSDNQLSDFVSELDPGTSLMLINAISFKGGWKLDSDHSRKGFFHGRTGNSIKDFFTLSGVTSYRADTDYRLITLPYGNGAFEMICVLPEEARDISFVIENLETICSKGGFPCDASIALPEFSSSYKNGMTAALRKTGLTTPFSSEADFSDIHKGLMISDVIQQAMINVDGQGTTFATGTDVRFIASGIGGELEKIEVKLDRPFVFLVREKSSKTVLLIGSLSE